MKPAYTNISNKIKPGWTQATSSCLINLWRRAVIWWLRLTWHQPIGRSNQQICDAPTLCFDLFLFFSCLSGLCSYWPKAYSFNFWGTLFFGLVYVWIMILWSCSFGLYKLKYLFFFVSGIFSTGKTGLEVVIATYSCLLCCQNKSRMIWSIDILWNYILCKNFQQWIFGLLVLVSWIYNRYLLKNWHSIFLYFMGCSNSSVWLYLLCLLSKYFVDSLMIFYNGYKKVCVQWRAVRFIRDAI